MPLPVLRGERKPGARWTERDGLLFTALTLHEDDLCPGCGWPMSYSTDADSAGHWSAEPAPTCQACKEVGRKQQGEKNPKPWQRTIARPDRALLHALRHPTHEQVGWLRKIRSPRPSGHDHI